MLYATPQGWRVLQLGLVGAVVISLLSVGCQSTAGNSPNKPQQRGMDGPVTGTGSSAQNVELARKTIEGGDPSAVIPRLLHVISVSPTSKPALDARYWLAVAYREMGSYRDSIEMYGEYLRLAPDGKYAQNAASELDALNREYQDKFQTPEEIDANIRELAGRVQQNPGDIALQMTLANALWTRGDYQSAAKIYNEVLRTNPGRANDPELRDRIESLPQGGFVVLTPSEIQRREAERQPLFVFNTRSFKSGKDLFTREPLYYAVSGQVVNRGPSVMYGVEVVITVYGFGNMVYDTNTIHIGRMNPGEIRSFSSRFSSFDNIDEVQRFECVASAG